MAENAQSESKELFEQARRYHLQGMNGYAIQYLERVIRLYEYSDMPTDEMLGESHKWLGLISSWSGYHHRATMHIEKAIELGVEPSPAMIRELGASLFLQGNYDRAIEPLRKALSQNNEDVQIRFALALSCIKVSEAIFLNRERLDENYISYKREAIEHYQVLKNQEPSMATFLQGSIENAAWQPRN